MRQHAGQFKRESEQWWYHPPAGRRRRATEAACDVCGKEFLHASLLGQRRYCSAACHGLAASDREWAGPECAHKSHAKNYRQDADGHWWFFGPRGRQRAYRKYCELCGTPYPIRSSYFNKSRFCSFSCRSKVPKRKGRKPFRQSDGYVLVYQPKHSEANYNGYVRQHRLVMEEHLSRLLLSTETVHHKNGKRDDNRLSNLELHNSSHARGQTPEDLVVFAREILALYTEAPHCPTCTCDNG